MQDSSRRTSDFVGSSPADEFEPDLDSVPAWTLHERDLDDLESSLRYLEREDRSAWEHVNLLLSELREDVQSSEES